MSKLRIVPYLPRLTSDFSENDITDVIDETFTTTEDRFGEMVTVELKPGGKDIPVTQENKKDYVEYVP